VENREKHILKIIGIPDDNRVDVGYNDGFLKEFLLNFDGNSSFLENITLHNAHITTAYLGGKDHFQTLQLAFKPDIIVNMMCDPEVQKKSLLLFENLNFKAPILNHPRDIAKTARDTVSQNLHSTPEFIIPKTYRIAPNTKEEIRALGKHYFGDKAFLFRPVSSHGGEGLFKIDDVTSETFDAFVLDGNKEYFLSEFVDFKNSEGVYQKARFYMINAKAYPRHYIDADTWKIHAHSRESMKNIEEEKRFLENPPPLFEKFCAYVYAYLKLDFFGVDCAMLPDGKIVLFEANVCMRPFANHTQEHLQAAEKNLLTAFGALLNTRIESRTSKV